MTLDEFDPLRTFSTVALGLFVLLVALGVGRMYTRFRAFRKAGEPVPLLLKRDMVLFGVFVAYFGLLIVFRLMGFQLTQNPFWVVPSTTAVLGGMAFWVWVEFRMDR